MKRAVTELNHMTHRGSARLPISYGPICRVRRAICRDGQWPWILTVMPYHLPITGPDTPLWIFKGYLDDCLRCFAQLWFSVAFPVLTSD